MCFDPAAGRESIGLLAVQGAEGCVVFMMAEGRMVQISGGKCFRDGDGDLLCARAAEVSVSRPAMEAKTRTIFEIREE